MKNSQKLCVLIMLSSCNITAKNSDGPKYPLKRQQVYAPHREAYLHRTTPKPTPSVKKPCVFCTKIKQKNDKKNLLVSRFKHHAIWLALYPYNKGHLLIIPRRHVGNLEDLTQPEQDELMYLMTNAPKILKEHMQADGANVGINLGKIAGASKPDHMHIHVIPRYNRQHKNFFTKGFMETTGGTQVIHWDMLKVYALLKSKFDALKD